MILTGRDEADIKEWSRTFKEDIQLRIFINDDAGRQLNAFCVELANLTPGITIKHVDESDTPLSKIMVSRNISYSALPLSRELEPFLKILNMTASYSDNFPDVLRSVVTSIKIPAKLKIYISPHCPFCPLMVTQCLAIARINSVIGVRVIDGSLYPDQAAKDKISSVPTLILDDSFRWIGSVDPEELVRMIIERDPVLLGTETLRSIIHDGRAEELAEMMLSRGDIFPAFVELLTDDNWSNRLGAMAAFEFLAEKGPDLCHKINIELCERFNDQEIRIQGDILYLLGESGDMSVVPFLKKVINGTYVPEVVEAAVDAMKSFTVQPA